jgi:hypothetical protein
MAVNPQVKNLVVRPPKAPNLLIAPVSYSQLYIDQLNNALRLYFNQIDNFGSGLLNGTGGSSIKFPYGAFHQDGVTTLSANMTNVSTTPIQVASTASFPSAGLLLIENEIAQYTGKTATTFTGITRGVKSTTNVAHTAGVAITEVQGITVGTAAAFLLNNTDYSNGITVSNDTRVNIGVDGIYNIQFSIQLLNYDTNDDNVTVWLKKNGTDLANSASVDQVPSKHGSYAGACIMSLNIVEQFAAGDYFELYWHTDLGHAVVATYPAGTTPVHPVSPSLIMTVTFVSAV